MFLLDTNVLAELRKIAVGKGHPKVALWARSYPEDQSYLSVLTLHEAEVGTLRMERRDPRQGAILRAWMDAAVLPRFGARILPVNRAIVIAAARLHVPDPAPFADSLIAATAIIHGLTVVTRNTRDFTFPGVAVLNPWDN
jgi:toxin FitB